MKTGEQLKRKSDQDYPRQSCEVKKLKEEIPVKRAKVKRNDMSFKLSNSDVNGVLHKNCRNNNT